MRGIAARTVVLSAFIVCLAGAESLAGPFPVLGQVLPAPGSIAPWSGDLARPSGLAAMPIAGEVAAPPGYLAFCSRHPDQCSDDGAEPDSIAWTPAVQQELEAVNLAYNTAIKPMEDSVHYGRFDYWAIPADGYGDCEDYALAKRKALADAGLPRRALRLALVRLPDGETHAVLTAVTSQGDYVLDNLTGTVLPWDGTGLAWIARQVPGQTEWAAIGHPAGTAQATADGPDSR